MGTQRIDSLIALVGENGSGKSMLIKLLLRIYRPTESDIFRRFQQFTKNRCSIIISHRIGAARIAQRILVLEHGKLVEDGSHQELINQNGVYRNLYQLQAQWYM